jgi:hypothetical protein
VAKEFPAKTTRAANIKTNRCASLVSSTTVTNSVKTEANPATTIRVAVSKTNNAPTSPE